MVILFLNVGKMVNALCYMCLLFIVDVIVAFNNVTDSKYSIHTLSTCEAKISNYGVVNLKPLERTDGFPRFSTYYLNKDRPESAAWNFSFNPCSPFNEPFDLSGQNNIFGEKCLYVSVCKFGRSAGRYFYYTYGTQRSAVFTVQNVDQPLITLSFNGSGGNARKKTHVRLVCDKSITDPAQATFTVIDDNLRYGIIAELRHICCCPDACKDGIIPGYNNPVEGNNFTKKKVTSQRITRDTSPTTTPADLVDSNDKNNSTLTGMEVVENKKKKNSTTLLLIVGLNIGLLLVAGVIGTMCYTKRSSSSPQIYSKLPGVGGVPASQMNFSKIDLEKDTLEMPPQSSRNSVRDYEPWANRKKQVMMPVFEDCTIANDNIELAQRLGGSVYGDTYVGDVKGLKVAVTRITLNIHKNQITADILKWLKDEVWFLSRQRHRNIVAMLGLCTENKLPYIMSEFIEGFTVKSYLQNKGDLVSWPLRVKICLQAADGVAYLHSTKPPIIHRDLRCANIFISDHEIVKVGDFGLIKLIQPLRSICRQEDCCCQGHFCACPSTLRWTAPEILNNSASEEADGFISLSSDVYSFGVVMWEVVTSEDPFDDVNTEQEVMELVKEGVRPTIPADVMPQYKVLMNQCWNGQPENRPSFKQVASKLKELVSPARTFQKNIFNKTKLQKMQLEVNVNDSINRSLTKYNSVSESVDLNMEHNTQRTESFSLVRSNNEDTSRRTSESSSQIQSNKDDSFVRTSDISSRDQSNTEESILRRTDSPTRVRSNGFTKKSVEFKENVEQQLLSQQT